MPLRETVSDWLAALGRPLGLQLALDESGAAGLALEGGVNVVVEVEDALEAVHLHAEVLRLPREAARRAPLMEAAMALNLYTRRTEGATLGLDGRSDALVLSVMQNGDEFDAAQFGGQVAAFGEVVQRLRAELEEAPVPREESAPARPEFQHLDPRFRA